MVKDSKTYLHVVEDFEIGEGLTQGEVQHDLPPCC